ncbi:hypothetical protein [Cupriavidus neocaledonicus]|uniref:hypothetical protein n=1 Tax=Cupriavidus neocaledonicus TaxID=1040979 RepID=UPI00036B444B|nr:hypothetical protein [Cupriavidus neocaledonicus]
MQVIAPRLLSEMPKRALARTAPEASTVVGVGRDTGNPQLPGPDVERRMDKPAQ